MLVSMTGWILFKKTKSLRRSSSDFVTLDRKRLDRKVPYPHRNEGWLPTFIYSGSQTVIDVTLFLPCIANLVSKWHVRDTVTMLDHHWIEFEIDL